MLSWVSKFPFVIWTTIARIYYTSLFFIKKEIIDFILPQVYDLSYTDDSVLHCHN